MAGLQVTHDADQVADKLHRAAAALGDLEATNTEAGRLVLARANPPVRTGRLASGLFAKTTNAGTDLASSAPYWTFVHWGAPRAHVRANPFLLAATRATTREVVALYTEHAREALDL